MHVFLSLWQILPRRHPVHTRFAEHSILHRHKSHQSSADNWKDFRSAHIAHWMYSTAAKIPYNWRISIMENPRFGSTMSGRKCRNLLVQMRQFAYETDQQNNSIYRHEQMFLNNRMQKVDGVGSGDGFICCTFRTQSTPISPVNRRRFVHRHFGRNKWRIRFQMIFNYGKCCSNGNRMGNTMICTQKLKTIRTSLSLSSFRRHFFLSLSFSDLICGKERAYLNFFIVLWIFNGNAVWIDATFESDKEKNNPFDRWITQTHTNMQWNSVIVLVAKFQIIHFAHSVRIPNQLHTYSNCCMLTDRIEANCFVWWI